MGNDTSQKAQQQDPTTPDPVSKDIDPLYVHKVNQAHLDFLEKNPVYDIDVEKKGPQFSRIDDLRAEYIHNFAATYKRDLQVPQNIPGLVRKVGELPVTRRFWQRPSSSFQRNGFFNMQTKNFNTRIAMPFFWIFLLYGWWGHQTSSWYIELYEDNYESRENIYDKMNIRMPPQTKLWLRPG